MVYHKRKAIAHLEKSLQINPEYLPSLFLLCESYFEQNENELAIECLDRIKNIDPENPKYLFFSSKVALKNGDLTLAKELTDRCFSNKYFDLDILKLGLRIAKTLKSNKDKIFVLENWILHHDASVNEYLELAKSLDQPCHYEKACYYFQVAQELDPANIQVLIESARFHLVAKQELSDGTVVSKKNHEQAKTILNKALTIDKDSLEAISMLGDISFNENKFSEAKTYFNQCYKANFKKDFYLLKLGKIAEETSQSDLQEKLLIEATSFGDLNFRAYAEILKLKLTKSKYTDGLSAGLRAIKHYRRKLRSLRKEINNFLKFNLFVESKDLAKELKLVTKELASVYYQFSTLHDLKIRSEKYLDQALQLNPHHAEANFQKALILKSKGSQKCIDHLKVCIDNSWYHWKARWEYICLNGEKMPNDELISYLKIICEANPSHQKAKLKLKTLNSTDFQNEKG